jgi:hypothetical protein
MNDSTIQEWRISKDGLSIKTGWGDNQRIIAKYPGIVNPLSEKKYQEWLDNAEYICELKNKSNIDMLYIFNKD